MARCETCGHKIKPNQRFCGKTDCSNKDKIIPRCIKCNGLVFEGKELCPADKQPCVVAEGNTVKILTKTDYHKVVS